MSAWHLLLWVALPYIAITVFIAGHIWRYRTDQYGWTSRSTQLLESRKLKWGSILFHYGALAAIGGHLLGILVPATWTSAFGVSEHSYHLLSAGAGTLAGLACVVGFVILAWRRITTTRVRVTTSRMDLLVYALLGLVIGLGIAETIGRNTLGGGYDYRATVAVWFRSIVFLHPEPSKMVGVPVIYQVHATAAWLLFLIWPFTRLVHAWSIPLQYVGRPFILYRRRWAPAKQR
jgi:nitrate reductase gamma subunit